jgi:hypothetical protein
METLAVLVLSDLEMELKIVKFRLSMEVTKTNLYSE